MGFKDLLKSAGMIDGEDVPEEHKEKVHEKVSQPVQVSPISTFVPTTSMIDDSKYVELLQNSLNEFSAKNPGYDIVKFQNVLNSMIAAIPDEKIRYTTAFNAVKAVGASVDSLKSSADACLRVISEEQSGFDSAISQAIAKDITSKEKRIAEIESRKEEIQKTIEGLSHEANSLNDESLKITSELGSKKYEIENKKNAFASARSKIESVVVKVKENLSNYLN